MKKHILNVLLLFAALASCSHEEIPVRGESDSQPLPAPAFSRSISAASATIVGYSADGTILFNHDLQQTDAENNTWDWMAAKAPTKADLTGVETLVCLVPAQTVSGTSLSVAPESDTQLMWDKVSVSEQAEDGRFYFQNVRHRLSKLCIETDHYESGDCLYAYYHKEGTFDCLTGNFTALTGREGTLISPVANGEGLYTATFSVVPQTFEASAELLRYEDVTATGYTPYVYSMDEAGHVLSANHMLHLHPLWDSDWTAGSFDPIDVTGVVLNTATRTLYVGGTCQLTATVSPGNAHDPSVTWQSNNTSVATVSGAGKVTAKGNGTATITVTTVDGGYKATCRITVKTKVTGVTMQPVSGTYTYNATDGVYEMYEGDAMTFAETVTPSTASNRAVGWSSANSAVATVANGTVTAVQAGTTTITVKTNDGSYTATATVRVKAKGSMGTVNENMGENTGSGNIGW